MTAASYLETIMGPTRKFDTPDARYRREALPAMAQVSAPIPNWPMSRSIAGTPGGKFAGDYAAISMNS